MPIERPPCNPDRRTVLLGAGAALTALSLAPTGKASAGLVPLTARPATALLRGPGQPPTAIWGFDGAAPGPVLRLTQGDELAVRFVNQLPEPSTVHWHGIRNANAMDGVPGLTQDFVPPGGSFDYRFTPPDAGTFWYHPHARSFEQVPRGLTGALIVEERDPPQADQDIVLLLNDWRLDAAGQIADNFGSRDDAAHAGRTGELITVNGAPFASLPVRLNERVRLRIINACSARVFTLLLEGAAPKLVALDGQPVGPTTSYGDALTLGPANRIDLMLDIIGVPGGRMALTDISAGRRELAALEIAAGAKARPEPIIAPLALRDNPLPEPAPRDALAVPLVLTGGAAGDADHSLARGIDQIWQFNGRAGAIGGICGGGDALFRVTRGRTVQLRLENRSAYAHAMHVHGHHFRLLERLNGPPPEPFWWDTLLVQPGETSLIAFVADNLGKWMLHCHMLDHQAAGMDSWFEVTA